jgi:hypothetical protein
MSLNRVITCLDFPSFLQFLSPVKSATNDRQSRIDAAFGRLQPRKLLNPQRHLDRSGTFYTVLTLFRTRADDSFPSLNGSVQYLRDCFYAALQPLIDEIHISGMIRCHFSSCRDTDFKSALVFRIAKI